MAFRSCDQLLSCIFIFYLLFHTNSTPCSSRILTNAPAAPLPSQTHSIVTSLRTHTSPWASFLSTLLGANKGMRANGISELKKHLTKLGYMVTTNSNSTNLDLFDHELESAVKKYQLYFNLKVTGTLDSHTVSKLSYPRCGVADNFPDKVTGANVSSEFFNTFSSESKWPSMKKRFTYAFLNDTRNFVRSPITAALKVWECVSGFEFQRIKNNKYNADIKMSFEYGHHSGDDELFDEPFDEPFDGAEGIVAHAFPLPKGIIHFDGAENWAYGNDGDEPDHDGIDFLTVAAHELGHVLGLGHSSHPEAVMYPSIPPGEKRRSLTEDDINAFHDLYGYLNVCKTLHF